MKIRKKLLGYLAVIGLGFAAFGPSTMIGNTAYAQTAGTAGGTTDTTLKQTSVEEGRTEFWDFIDLALKLIYVVLRPMLFLAGIAMDNSMVYGSVFHMDAPLWTFWNMTKNFANFMLLFIVLFSILKGIFSSFGKDKGNDARSPMTVIKNTLIAGVLIQASWFLTAALIDISTVATYSIGGMPTALLKNDNTGKIKDKKFLPSHSQLDLDNVDKIGEKELMVRYKIPLFNEEIDEKERLVSEKKTIDVSPCLVRQLGASSYIVGRAYGSTTTDFNHTNKEYITKPANINRNICVFGNKIYFFNEFPNVITGGEENYSSNLMRNINDLSKVAKDVANCGFFIDLRETKRDDCTDKNIKETLKKGSTSPNTGQTFEDVFGSLNLDKTTAEGVGEDGINIPSRISKTAAPTIGTIIEKSKGFMGPLATIYVSIMDFANLGDTSLQNSSFGKTLGDLLIRVGVALGMVFPLIALAVVLFIRIGYLWVVIAASPILILANVFKDTLKIDKLLETFSIENILKAMFAPVITVFALSISVVFMTTLSGTFSKENAEKINVFSNLHITQEKGPDPGFNYLTFLGYTVAYPKQVSTYAGATGDRFSWIIISFCGIGIMWFILFAAIKASGVIGKVGESIKTFGENVFKTAPIVPIAGGVGVGTLKEQLIDGNFAEKYRETRVVDLPEQQKRMESFVEERFPEITKGNEFGRDRTFSEPEKTTVREIIGSGNSDKIISALESRGFIDKKATNKQEELKKLYEESSDFREMSQNMAEPLQGKLFGSKTFISEKKAEEQKKLIDNLAKKINDQYDNKKKLDEAIKKIDENDFKNIEDGKQIKEITASDKKYKIIKKENKLVAEESTS